MTNKVVHPHSIEAYLKTQESLNEELYERQILEIMQAHPESTNAEIAQIYLTTVGNGTHRVTNEIAKRTSQMSQDGRCTRPYKRKCTITGNVAFVHVFASFTPTKTPEKKVAKAMKQSIKELRQGIEFTLGLIEDLKDKMSAEDYEDARVYLQEILDENPNRVGDEPTPETTYRPESV